MITIRHFVLGLFVGALFLLSGCVAVPRATDGKQLNPGQGILAIKIKSNANARLGILPFSSESTFGSRFAENMVGAKAMVFIKEGDAYALVPLDAGDYMWSKLEIGQMFSWLQASNKFTVKANTITYAGDFWLNVESSRYTLAVRDREADMREYLRTAFPEYSRTMEFEKILAKLNL